MNGYSVSEAIRLTGYPKSLFQKKIWVGDVPVVDGLIEKSVVDRILCEKSEYLSFQDFAKSHSTDAFNGKLSKDRAKMLDFIEENDYFGLSIADHSAICMGTEADEFFFLRADEEKLESRLKDFLKFFNVSEKDKVSMLLENCGKEHENTVRLLRSFIEDCLFEDGTIPPAFTEFVRVMLEMPDVPELKTGEITKYMHRKHSVTCKEYIVRFLNYCRNRTDVCYTEVSMKSVPRKSIPAYTDETYIALMKCIFNSRHIAENQMIEKALENHLYAEAWLYLALFITCGWRAGDICIGWKYPRLAQHEDRFPEINRDTLTEDILNDVIPDRVYEDVCKYCLSSVIASEQLPGKTSAKNPTTLRDIIVPELYTFYGLLTLIAESVMIRTGDGYMNPQRTSVYQNKVTLRSFFGPDILIPLKGENIQSRRLNKCFLQGVEKTARQNGNEGIMASAVASYARNHTSLETITHYLKDHNLSGENAEMVLYFMMERGVFGFELYQTLLMAYPDAVKRLPMKKQNELISMFDCSPMELDLHLAGVLEQNHIQEQFRAGHIRQVTQTLKAMFEISQTRGKAKDTGIYCIRRALGQVCEHPEYDSCLENGCPHLVFTRYGLIPLLEILKRYIESAKTNRKDDAVLKKVLIPRYQEIINGLMRSVNMRHAEQTAVKQLMKEVLYE